MHAASSRRNGPDSRHSALAANVAVREGNATLASGPTLDVSMLYVDLPL